MNPVPTRSSQTNGRMSSPTGAKGAKMRSRSAKVLANRSRISNNRRTLMNISRVSTVDSPRGRTKVRIADIRVVATSTAPAAAAGIRSASTAKGQAGDRLVSKQGLGQLAPLPLRNRRELGRQHLQAHVVGAGVVMGSH